jgi:hypothetical protein
MEDEVAKPHTIIEHDKFHGITGCNKNADDDADTVANDVDQYSVIL